MRILILGGSTESSQLVQALAGSPAHSPILSLAGRTKNPVLPPIPTRIGGFGGIPGLIAYLREESIDQVINATHPFAEQMSAHAQIACGATGTPLAAFTRRPWTPAAGDCWTEVSDVAGAAAAIGPHSRRVFLTVGRIHLAAFAGASQHDYLIRSVDPPDPPPPLPRFRTLLARGPFTFTHELELLRSERIEVLVSKNSGGDAARAKLDAAREQGIPVILIRPPGRHDVQTFYVLPDVLDFLRIR